MIQPKTGDRVIINGLPKNYDYKDLYRLISDNNLNQHKINGYKYKSSYGFTVDMHNGWFSPRKDNTVGGCSLYLPYKTNKKFDCSGVGRNCKITDLTFIENTPAPFWNFDNKPMSAGGGVVFWEDVNYFEVNFNNLIR